MSDTAATKNRLTAYQRWELPIFDVKQAVAQILEDPLPVLPTAAELEQLHQQAHEEGYQAGFAEGAQQAQRLAALMHALDTELQQVDQKISQDLLDLSLEIAKQMLKQALKVKPDLLLSVVREAIASLPHFNQHAHLIVHPADAELLRVNMGEHLTHMGWKIFEDAQMERGSCRLETANSQIDASLATRWKRIASSIGKDDTWLES